MPDRFTETIDGVEFFQCGSCLAFKPRDSYPARMKVDGTPTSRCRRCDFEKARANRLDQARKTKRSSKRAASEIPPPPPEFEVPPSRVAQGKRLACPHCHETALREPANGRPGYTTWLVSCAYCPRLSQLVEVSPDGSARSIPRRSVAAPATSPSKKTAFARPACKHPTCADRAEEYGLCAGHLSRCRMDGRLDDVDAWAAECAPPPPPTPDPTPASAEHPPKKKKKRRKRVDPGECRVTDCVRKSLASSHGLCNSCYVRWKNRGKQNLAEFALIPPRRFGRELVPCCVEGCDKTSKRWNRLCDMHRMRWLMAGKPDLEEWVAAGALTATEWRKLKGVEVSS